MSFIFETTVLAEWIDYNGHMRDSNYGLIFSLAVDAMQDEVGFDAAYRNETGCTIYLLEDHKYYLREVKEGARLRIETRVMGCDAKRFHLYLQMFDGDILAAVGEFMEVHVSQHPIPRAVAMPMSILAKLEAATVSKHKALNLKHRARAIGLV